MFSIGTKILDELTGKKGIVVGTKDNPYKPKFDPFNRAVIPFEIDSMDYQIMFLRSDGDYSGICERKEGDLTLLME